MDDLPRRRLVELVGRFGREVANDPRRFESLLRDLCGNSYKREVFVLVNGVREGIAAELAAYGSETPLDALVARLVRRMHTNLGVTEELATWAVESWSLALGLQTAPTANSVAPPVDLHMSLGGDAGDSRMPTSSPTDQGAPTARAKALARSADFYLLEGDYDCAIANATLAIQLNPKFALAYYARSAAYLFQGNCDRALADATEAIRLNPEYAKAYCKRAVAHLMHGNYDRALADATEAIRLNPEYAWAYCTRAKAHLMHGDYDRAMVDAREAIQFDPKFAEAWSVLTTAVGQSLAE
ncbi:MAG: tetratricopeptide repeat protein [Planctomycetota bacterium]|nr:tetratricopeptide repeat protein [Planctomycetota bacterium]